MRASGHAILAKLRRRAEIGATRVPTLEVAHHMFPEKHFNKLSIFCYNLLRSHAPPSVTHSASRPHGLSLRRRRALTTVTARSSSWPPHAGGPPTSTCVFIASRISGVPDGETADGAVVRSRSGQESEDGGPGRNRTDVRGFAGRCITTLPPDRCPHSRRIVVCRDVNKWSNRRCGA